MHTPCPVRGQLMIIGGSEEVCDGVLVYLYLRRKRLQPCKSRICALAARVRCGHHHAHVRV